MNARYWLSKYGILKKNYQTVLNFDHLSGFFCDNMFSLIFIDMQKEDIPDFLIQGKDQEGFEERYINDFIGKYFSGWFQCT